MAHETGCLNIWLKPTPAADNCHVSAFDESAATCIRDTQAACSIGLIFVTTLFGEAGAAVLIPSLFLSAPIAPCVLAAIETHSHVTELRLIGCTAPMPPLLYNKLTTLVIAHSGRDLEELFAPLSHPACRLVTLDVGSVTVAADPAANERAAEALAANTSLRTLTIRESTGRAGDIVLRGVACNKTLDELAFMWVDFDKVWAWVCLEKSGVLVFGTTERDAGFQTHRENGGDAYVQSARLALNAWADARELSFFRRVLYFGTERGYSWGEGVSSGSVLYVRHRVPRKMPRLPERCTALRAMYEWLDPILPCGVVDDIVARVEFPTMWGSV